MNADRFKKNDGHRQNDKQHPQDIHAQNQVRNDHLVGADLVR